MLHLYIVRNTIRNTFLCNFLWLLSFISFLCRLLKDGTKILLITHLCNAIIGVTAQSLDLEDYMPSKLFSDLLENDRLIDVGLGPDEGDDTRRFPSIGDT